MSVDIYKYISKTYDCIIVLVLIMITVQLTNTRSYASQSGLNSGYNKVSIDIIVSDELSKYINKDKVLNKIKNKIEKITGLKVTQDEFPMLGIMLSASVIPGGIYGVLTQSTIMLEGGTNYSYRNGPVAVDNSFVIKVVKKDLVAETISNQIDYVVDEYISSFNKDSKMINEFLNAVSSVANQELPKLLENGVRADKTIVNGNQYIMPFTYADAVDNDFTENDINNIKEGFINLACNGESLSKVVNYGAIAQMIGYDKNNKIIFDVYANSSMCNK